MGQFQVGTASWTDRTLIAAGWYPPGVNTPEKRLRYYASQFSRYTAKELKHWAPRIAALAQDAKITYVAFNNCYRNWAQANAQQLGTLLELPAGMARS
jgi:hypothetical protein